jgi:exosortase E/protease (VPEID-CTERM system)
MLVGARWSPEIALGSFHSKAGWVLFCGLALGLLALTRSTSLFARDLPLPERSSTWNPTAAYLSPLLALVGVNMVVGLVATGSAIPQLLGVLAGAAVLWRYRSDHSDRLRLSWSWQALTLGLVAFALWIALQPSPDPTAAWHRGLATLPVPLAAALLAARVFGSVLVVPTVEELAFRGFLLRRLVSADFTSVSSSFRWAPFLVSSVAYGLLHERWLAGILVGMIFALAQQRRGRLADAILAHAVCNLLVGLQATGWGVWPC